ncbi:MAG: HupE/UreJ family protein [Bacteroidia bacterium]|nr:HupE/UreJ family protein [Bacteroidia bacterium]
MPTIYLQLGFEHILDPQGYDHMLFIVALCAAYRPAQWRNIVVLVTAFTIGHSVTLALAVLDLFRLPEAWVELGIPVTIFLTCLYNLWHGVQERSPRRVQFNYLLALLFGFIHGMGFSNYLRSLLAMGGTEQVAGPLLFFNLGIEGGQLVLVALMLGLAWAVLDRLKAPHRYWNWAVSGIAALAALQLIAEKAGELMA